MIKHGQIATPPISAGALGGITRSVVFEIAAELGIDPIAFRIQNETNYYVLRASSLGKRVISW